MKISEGGDYGPPFVQPVETVPAPDAPKPPAGGAVDAYAPPGGPIWNAPAILVALPDEVEPPVVTAQQPAATDTQVPKSAITPAIAELRKQAQSLAEQLSARNYAPADLSLASTAASSLRQLAANAYQADPEFVGPAIQYWSDIAKRALSSPLPDSTANQPAFAGVYPSTPSPDVGNFIGKLAADGNSFTDANGLVFVRAGISKNFYVNGDQTTAAYFQRPDGVIWNGNGQYAGWAPIFVYRPESGTSRTLSNGWTLFPDGKLTDAGGKQVGTLTNGQLYGMDGKLASVAAQAEFAKTAANSSKSVDVLPGQLSADGKTYTAPDGVTYAKDMNDGNDRFIAADGTKIRMGSDGTMFSETTYQVYGRATKPGSPAAAATASAIAAQAPVAAPQVQAAQAPATATANAQVPKKKASSSSSSSSTSNKPFAGVYPAQPSTELGNYIGKLSDDGNTFTTQDGLVFERKGISKHFYLNGDESTFAYFQRPDGVIWNGNGQYAGWAPIFVYRPEPNTSRKLSNGWTLYSDGRVTAASGKRVGTLTNGLLYGMDGKQLNDNAQADFAKVAANSSKDVKVLAGKLSKDGKTYTDPSGVTYAKDMTNGNNVYIAADGTKIRMANGGTMFSEDTYQVYGTAAG